MQWVRKGAGAVLLIWAIIAWSLPPASHTARVLGFLTRRQQAFAASARQLEQSVAALDGRYPKTLHQAREDLAACRVQYKQLAFFLEYFFSSEAYVFNSPAKYEIEEPFMEYEQPVGLQQLEALLYDDSACVRKPAMVEEAQVIASSARDIPGLFYHFTATDAQILESTRLELVRIMSLYISGYDAPMAKSGLREAIAALQALDSVYTMFDADSAEAGITRNIHYLQQDTSFDHFNRLTFLADYAIPLQRQLRTFAATQQLELNTAVTLNPAADNLFSADAFSMKAFPGGSNTDTMLVKQGRSLFFNKALSGHNDRSCATCHQPDRYFTDGLERNTALNGGKLPRNTPTLLYSCFQYSQFWDGRVKSLEEQVLAVMHNPDEMNACDDSVLHRLRLDSMGTVTRALAAYIRTLRPFSAAFDTYLQGDKKAMTPLQQHGFNIFMGKAQCGTCHFAPVFNGLTPPLYNRTEFEVLAAPLTENLVKRSADTDLGRYDFFRIDFYKGAFKTPTVRNAAVTGPYLHHGAFHSLEQVVEFYDRGGMHASNQTLAATPLQLSANEKKALVAFMQALTDKPSY
ncbi:cytochrome-c peroxidase [Chitinophaga parva]|nr:cytochrome c peroxidase [Chitinophaga parva]